MDRHIVYAGSIPLDTDQLYQARHDMIGLGYLAQAILGTGTYVDGLVCTPAVVPNLTVQVSAGSIYSLQNVDATSFGSLAADTTNQVVKQGIVQGTATLACPAPATTGQSVVHLVQATYQDTDAGSTVLPYYNAANPSVPYSGPANSGVAQFTVRKGVCVVSLKTGIAAATGTQATPAPDAGYVGLWAITVANGQATITSGNIAQLATAPFFTKLPLLDKLAVKAVRSQSFSSSGTYTPHPAMLYCVAEIVGGGGGGGGAAAGANGSAAGGGGGGEFARGVFSRADIGASISFTVGSAGGGGAAGNNNGTGGSTTTFGTLTAGGGGGGAGGAAPANPNGRGAPGGTGGTGGTGGDTHAKGDAGSTGIILTSTAIGGAGGGSFFSGCTANASENINGAAAGGYGGGGGGAASGGNNQAGGNGAAGFIRITEYCYL